MEFPGRHSAPLASRSALVPLHSSSAPSNAIAVILSSLISLYMPMTTSLGFAISDADFDGGTDPQLTAQAPWILGASVLESAVALLLTL